MPYTEQFKTEYNTLIVLETEIENAYTYQELKPLVMHYLVDMCEWKMRKNAGIDRLVYALISRCIQLEKRIIGLKIRIKNDAN